MAFVLHRTANDQTSGTGLKEVLAIIRSDKWRATQIRLAGLPLPPFTQHRVLGRGAGRGLRYLQRQDANGGVGLWFLPKRMVSWTLEEEQVPLLLQAIFDANQTGHPGDGKIFVMPVLYAIDIGAGEREIAAELPPAFAVAAEAQLICQRAPEGDHAARQ
jgi:nitrogen regulatory protein PII 2